MLLQSCFRILGILLMLFSLTLLPPLLLAWFTHDPTQSAFLLAMMVTFFTGWVMWYPFRRSYKPLRTRDGFLIVVLFWTVLSLFAALPFLAIQSHPIALADAVFESVSGLTTTGASVLSDLDSMPQSILYYRAQLQFVGGMGIIVLAVAILPMLGIGGMQLFRAETTGPVKDNKLTPRITETAKALWYIYVGLTIACIGCYWILGMPWFDAITYAFATVSTGGYAPHDASMGFYPNLNIQLVAILFMLFGSMNFSLHFVAVSRMSYKHYRFDSECKLYFTLLCIFSLIVAMNLIYHHVFDHIGEASIESVFHVVSIMSTTGLTTSNFSTWPSFTPLFIMLIGLIGGCAGSTSGGIKVIRVSLLIKQASREIKRLVHPTGQFLLKIDHKRVPNRIMDALTGYIAIYAILFFALVLSLMAVELDFITAFSSVIACLANVGPGLGKTAAHFGDLNDFAKWLLTVAMLIGRLEIFTFIVLLSPVFWHS